MRPTVTRPARARSGRRAANATFGHDPSVATSLVDEACPADHVEAMQILLRALAAVGMVVRTSGVLLSARPASRALVASITVASISIACAGEAAAAPADAPLGVVTPGPFRALFLDMPLADARGPARTTLDLRWSMANSWSMPATLTRGGKAVEVQLDAQIETLQLSVAIPWRRFFKSALAERLSTTFEARALAIWGGWSDGAIEAWHRLVNTTNFERNRWPRDSVAVRLAEVVGPHLVDAHSARLSLGDVVLRSALRLAGASPDEAQSRWTLALRLDVKLPAGSPERLGGSGGVDGGVGGAATFLATRWLTAHALASMRAVSDLPREIALQPRRFQAGLDLSLVARLGAIAVLLEDRISSPLFEGGWRLPASADVPAAAGWYALFRPHNQVSVGIRWRELTAFFCEDFTPGGRLAVDHAADWFYESNAPDVVFGMAWARSF